MTNKIGTIVPVCWNTPQDTVGLNKVSAAEDDSVTTASPTGGLNMLDSLIFYAFLWRGLNLHSLVPSYDQMCVFFSFLKLCFEHLTVQSNAHMLLLISAPSRLQLCHREFPSLWALTEMWTLTDETQPAPACETPPLSLRSVSRYICFALACCHAGKNNSFVVSSSQSGSELGVVSCFLCSPDSEDLDPVAPFGFRNSRVPPGNRAESSP